MSELVQKLFNAIAGMFSVLLAHTEFGALAAGTMAAISITQVIKMIVMQSHWSNGGRGLWYGITFLIGLAVTWANWKTTLGFSWGLAVGGVLAPGLYVIGTRTLYKYFPDAEQKISATPRE